MYPKRSNNITKAKIIYLCNKTALAGYWKVFPPIFMENCCSLVLAGQINKSNIVLAEHCRKPLY
jgi:hypothetical protein